MVKFGALLFVLGLDQQNAINFQLLGGVWILQTFVAIVAGLYTRWFHRWALLAGWAVGMVYGTVVAYQQEVPNVKVKLVNGARPVIGTARGTSAAPLANFPFTDQKVYIAVTALLLNLIVAVVVTLVLRAMKAPAVPTRPSRATTAPTHRHAGSKPACATATVLTARDAARRA